MEGKVLAICDTEKQYVVRLMQKFCERKDNGFLIYAFSNVDDLVDFAEKTEIEILLITGRSMSERIGRFPIRKIILLSDGDVYEEFLDYETIYKYQSAEHIMKEVLFYCAEYARPVTRLYFGKKEFEVYGVYSPIGRCGKSALAESLAAHFGKRKKTLLLDLQSYSAWKEQMQHDSVWDLTDIIYFLRQGKKAFLYKLGSIVKNLEEYDYILPMKVPADLRSVSLSEWTELLEKLAADSDYHVVVIDFGNDVCGLFQLLCQCTKVYMPVLQDEESRRKLENLEWILHNEEFEKVMDNVYKVLLPNGFDVRNAKGFMKAWVERSIE